MDAFRVHLEGPSHLRLEGELDLLAAGELEKVLLPMCAQPRANVVLDLAGVDFMDSTGVALLLRAHREATRAEGHLTILGVTRYVSRVLHATGVDELLDHTEVEPG